MEDIMLLVMGKTGLKIENTPYRKTFLYFFGLSEVNHKERKGHLLSLIIVKSGSILIATLLEEMKSGVIKPDVAVNDDFACRDESKVLAHF